ncbi:MAG: DUF1624 domain-containing protein [Candidatus Hodarchaeales archaeon]
MNTQIKTDQGLKSITSYRITAIDIVRGLAIVLMALDHSSSYWNKGRFFGEFWNWGRPEFLPDLLQFLIRFVTHWCAPTFVFLAGTSLALSEAKRLENGISQNDITKHLVIRGLILLLIEWTLIAWLFEAGPFYFGVLATIGVSFIFFAIARRLKSKIILGFSLILLLDDIFAEFIWNPLFQPGYHPVTLSIFYFGDIFETLFGKLIIPFTNVPFISWLQAATHNPSWPYGLYPLDPWLGVMGVGIVFGRWLLQQQQKQTTNRYIAKRLSIAGSSMLGLFFILRIVQGLPTSFFPIWADTLVLIDQPFTIQNFFFMSKYPPSIVFLLWTLGGMCLALAIAFYFQENERFQGWMKPVILFGTTALFFYCAHLIIYGAVPILHGIVNPSAPSLMKAFDIWVTFVVWILGLITLYPLCLLFKTIKENYPDSPLKYI